ncbi:TetR family transcriptional regulator [Hwangdonia lutea]|uniref:Biofilm operon icaADBC HTH-type negative transcriptional regulator IcaR n=1 Tax=Hwangdonia lutea TaxID=3075823 RepID=A0AA97ELV4_9FLAO|nr:TetR family transcriptional regulator [Hwangdonia sp. SCSIO 19198]WOD43884.1 TetR family transcriptional regulator [Hwangdonia sp. SCSIO 19198]
MGRKSLKKTRQKEIVSAFYNVAKREGLENASIAKVAKEMGVNPSLIIHYFTSKEELIFGLINFILESYRFIYLAEEEQLNSRERLIKVVDNLFSREWNALFDDGVFYSCFSLIFRSQRIKTEFKELHNHLRQLLSEVIEAAKKDGHLLIENSKQTADLIFIMVEGVYYYLSLFDDETVYNEKLVEYKKAAFDILKLNTTVELN